VSPAQRREFCPLTWLQESMILSSRRAPRSGVYLVQDICKSAEELDSGLLQRTWRQVARRHAALRASVETPANGDLHLKIHADPDFRWQELDWTPITSPQAEEKLAAFLREDRERGFVLSEGVPMRFTLLRMPENCQTLVWTCHHALLDGRSLLVVWREWFELYDARRRGDEALLPDSGDFRDHLNVIEQQDMAAAEQFWREQLAGLAPTTEYVVDRLRLDSEVPHEDFAKESRSLPEDLTREVRSFARRHDVSVNNLIQAAWAVLLGRYSGRRDVVFGVTRTGRRKEQRGGADGVGVFINTLPFRVSVEPSAHLLPWLRQLRGQWLALREFEHTPLDKIRQWSGASLPLFDSVLVYDHEPPGETLRKLGGAWLHRTFHRLQHTDSPLTVVAYGAPRLTLEIVHDARLFSQRTVSGMTKHLETLLLSFLSQKDGPLAKLKMLPEQEQDWHLRELNQTDAPFARDQCVHRLFEQQVQRTPGNTALEHREGTVSFQELNRRANRLAWLLRECGAGPEDVIALHVPRGPDVVIAVLAVLKAGAAFMSLDPALPPERLAVMWEDARPKFVLCSDAGVPGLAGCGCQALRLETLEHEIARQSTENLPDIAVPANAAYAMFTSGSTGRPKAVVVTHRSLVNHTQAVAGVLGISPADRRLQFASLASDVFVSEVFTFLCSGVALVFGLNRENTSLREFLRLLAERRITVTGLPASWWKEWVSVLSTEGFELPQSLRAVAIGMERVDPATFRTWKHLVGRRIRSFNAYGPTETCPIVTIYEAGSSAWEGASHVPIGKPIANAKAYVFDSDGNVPPVGVPGELYIGGDAVGRGYLNAPELTAQKFLPDPFREDPAARLYRTGDLVYRLPDGNLIFLGRVDRQLKIRGFRVEPEEIEATLQQYPGVRECAVTTDSRERLVAYITWARPEAPFADELRLHLSRSLPAHMIPGEFLVLSDMPRTFSGKIDLQALPRLEAKRLRPTSRFKRPSTPTEKRVAALWQEALGISCLGVTDDFFESGGDSLSATVLITLIEREFDREISLASLFQASTIARLAAMLESDDRSLGNASRHDVIPLRSEGALLPFLAIAATDGDALRFHHVCRHLGNDQPFYAVGNSGGDSGRLQTVEALATEVCRTIRAAGLNGPYLLGGYCLGGIVAFEAAHQLLARGEDVRMVVLFDTALPGYLTLLRILRAGVWYFRHIGQVSGQGPERVFRINLRTLLSDARTVGGILRNNCLAYILRTALRAGWTPRVRADDIGNKAPRSIGIYVPKPLPVPVAQIASLARGIRPPILDDRRLGWRDLCRAEFHLRHVSGDHTTMWLEPHVAEMAAILKELLRPLNIPRGADIVV